MGSVEELNRLDRLIRQFETVYRMTKDLRQQDRVEEQLKELKQARKRLGEAKTIDSESAPRDERSDEFKHLRRLLDSERRRPATEQLEPLPEQEEVFNLFLYARFFKNEFLPLLSEKRLKLDYKLSQRRKGFYTAFSELERAFQGFRHENARLSNRPMVREVEGEIRNRTYKLGRQTKSDAAKYFHSIQEFCEELVEDAGGDRVKCLNANDEIVFDDIEGTHLLDGRSVVDALGLLLGFASEVVAYLNVPGV